jgi:ribosomal protein S18 acetylase RimI-like enzyme
LENREPAIRPALPEDSEALAHLHVDSWRAAYSGLVPESHLAKLDYVKRAERFRTFLRQSDDNFLVEIDDEIAGFLTVGTCRDKDLDRAATGEIWGIYLAQAFWRQGVGTALYRFGEQLLISRGYSQAVLWVLKNNAQARLFYEAMGFTLDGVEREYDFDAPLTGVRYHKALIK